MCAEDQGTKDDKKARRRRKWHTIGRIVYLLGACLFVPFFVTAIWIGYLSWIGILVGIVYLVPGILSPLAGLTGRKRLEGFLSWLSTGMPILLALAAAVAAIWPIDNSEQWKPYRFDEEFAVLEAERSIPEQDNAAIRCQALFALLDVDDHAGFFFPAGRKSDVLYKDTWTRVEHPEASQWLDSYDFAVNELVRAAGTRRFRWPLQQYTYDEPTVPYEPVGHGLQLLILSANRDLGEGRFDEAIVKYSCAIGMIHDLRQQMQPVEFRISYSYETRILRLIRRALVQHALSDRDIARIAERLPGTDNDWPAKATALFRAEKLRYMNLLARLYEVNPEGEVRFSSQLQLSPDASPQDIRWLRPYWPMNMPLDPVGLHRIAEDYFSSLDYLLEPGRLPLNGQESTASWTDLCRVLANCYRWFGEMAFYPADEYITLRQLHASLLAERRGTWLVLTLRHYRDEHRSWPPSLNEISEHVPPEAFVDPINGGPFVYARVDDSFRLYSTGFNRISDAESSPPDTFHDDVLIWPLPKPEPPKPRPKHEDVDGV